MSDERLRAVYERILRATREHGDAVSPEEMLALAEGRGDEATRVAILDRVMRDEATRRDFELLRAAIESAGLPRAARERSLRTMLAIAASVLLAAIIGITAWRLHSRGVDNVERGGAPAIRLAEPQDAPSSGGPIVFAWHRVPNARSYELELVESSGALVQLVTVADTTWSPPASVHLTPGTEYRWWVRATLTDGTVLEAPPRRLVVSP